MVPGGCWPRWLANADRPRYGVESGAGLVSAAEAFVLLRQPGGAEGLDLARAGVVRDEFTDEGPPTVEPVPSPDELEEEIAAPAQSSANNLRVTMTYLLRVLEPRRPACESAYLVRVDGQAVTLVTSDCLRVDVDRFDEHLTRAAPAEAGS
jgi:hypothetical protein